MHSDIFYDSFFINKIVKQQQNHNKSGMVLEINASLFESDSLLFQGCMKNRTARGGNKVVASVISFPLRVWQGIWLGNLFWIF